MTTLRLVIYLHDEPSTDGHIFVFHGDRYKLAADLETRQFLPVDRGAGSFAMIATNQIIRLEFERDEDESADELRRLSPDFAHTPTPVTTAA